MCHSGAWLVCYHLALAVAIAATVSMSATHELGLPVQDPPLLLLHTSDSTPAVSVTSLLQLVAAVARAAGAAAVAAGMNVDPGGLVVVREDNMPAGEDTDIMGAGQGGLPCIPCLVLTIE